MAEVPAYQAWRLRKLARDLLDEAEMYPGLPDVAAALMDCAAVLSGAAVQIVRGQPPDSKLK